MVGQHQSLKDRLIGTWVLGPALGELRQLLFDLATSFLGSWGGRVCRACASFGVSPLRLVCGRFSLKSSRHSASRSRTCASERNEVSFRHSSRSH